MPKKSQKVTIESVRGSCLDADQIAPWLTKPIGTKINAGGAMLKLASVTLIGGGIRIIRRGFQTHQDIQISYSRRCAHRKPGCRYFLHCGQCGKRFVYLYCGFAGYACRRCQGLRYQTTIIGNEKRRRLKRQRLLAKCNVHHDCGGIVRKPKLMRRTTFRSIRSQVDAIEHQLSTRWRRSHSRLTWRIDARHRGQ